MAAGAGAGLLSASPERLYHAVAIVPVREDLSSVDVQRLLGPPVERPTTSQGRMPPLLPNGSRGLSRVVARTADRLRVDAAAVAGSVRIEDSEDDPPSFVEEELRPRHLRVRATAEDRRLAERVAGTLAEEYVRYRREVLNQEGTTAVASLRTRAAILGSSAAGAANVTGLRQRAETVSTALDLDASRLGPARLEGSADRSTAPGVSRTVAVGGLVGLVFGLLLLEFTTPVRMRRV